MERRPFDSAEDREGVIPTWIVTRDDLNRAERDNIAAGLRWARHRGFDVLDPDDLMALHKRMFGHVWRLAGVPRQVVTNIARRTGGRCASTGAGCSATPAPRR